MHTSLVGGILGGILGIFHIRHFLSLSPILSLPSLLFIISRTFPGSLNFTLDSGSTELHLLDQDLYIRFLLTYSLRFSQPRGFESSLISSLLTIQKVTLNISRSRVLHPERASVSNHIGRFRTTPKHNKSNMSSTGINTAKMSPSDVHVQKKRKTGNQSIPTSTDIDDQDPEDNSFTSEGCDTDNDSSTDDSESTESDLDAEDNQGAGNDQDTTDEDTADESTGIDESPGADESAGSDEDPLEIPNKRHTPNIVQSLPVQEALRNLRDCLKKLQDTTSRSELAKKSSTYLSKIHQEALSQSEFKIPETRTLGFVGDSGAGMSLFLVLFYISSDNGRSL